MPAPSLLAWAFLERLDSSSSHANKDWNFLSRRRPCWRGLPWKVLIHRQATPTRTGIPVPAPSLLAWVSLQRLVSSSSRANKGRNVPCRCRPCWRGVSLERLDSPSSHANKARNFLSRRRLCWRGSPWKGLIHRRATPTRAGISRAGAVPVGVGFPGKT